MSYFQDKLGLIYEVSERANGVVRFHLQGGGFSYLLSYERFDKEMEPYVFGDFTRIPVTGDWLMDDDTGKAIVYKAWWNQTRWNGWVCPYFELDVALSMCDGLLSYDAESDQFTLKGDPNYESEDDIIGPTMIQCADGKTRKVYGIGIGYYTWSRA